MIVHIETNLTEPHMNIFINIHWWEYLVKDYKIWTQERERALYYGTERIYIFKGKSHW